MSDDSTNDFIDKASLKSIVSKLIKDEQIKLFLFGTPIEDVDLISSLLESTNSGGLLEGNYFLRLHKYDYFK